MFKKDAVVYTIKTYSLKCGGWCAEIAPDFGANIFRLTYLGADILRPLDDESRLAENPFVFGAPLLLPANRTSRGKFSFEGREYSLPVTEEKSGANLHGLLYSRKFSVLLYDSDRIELLFENTGEIYPFSFKIKVGYRIKDGKFISNYTVLNTDNRNMPFTFALHTTFKEPDIFSVPIAAKQERDNLNLPTGRYIPLNAAEKEYISGAKSAGNIISGYYSAGANRAVIGDVNYTVSDNFDHFILYNGGGTGGFLCIEPQCGAVDGLNIPGKHKILKPNEKAEFFTEIAK